MKANKKYKNSVFSFLFSDPDVLKELYCALKGVTLPDNVPVVINTLEDVLFMDRINDISFEIGGKLVVLIEHQSTINPNMALRLLMYITRIYEKIIKDKNIYSKRKITIPQPEFFILYNGTSPYPDENILKLSDLFTSIEPLGLEIPAPALELEVKVFNINEGKNEKIQKRCGLLSQYSAFVSKVREFEKDENILENAIEKAVYYCRNHDILKELLEENATEVFSMLMTEWNLDDTLAVRYEDGLEDGREEGKKLGIEEGTQRGKLQTAANFKKLGVSVEIIAQATGLSAEEIEKL